MKRTKSIAGKRFSRREVVHVAIAGTDFYYEQIDWTGVFSPQTVDAYKQKAVAVLVEKGIPVSALLEQSPHGSAVRDFVLNSQDNAPDSSAGLAAQLIEHALHLEAYLAMPVRAPQLAGLVYRFGRITTMFDVYAIDSEIQAKRRAGKPASNPYDTDRNARIRKYHKGLENDGAAYATAQTAAEFDLSTRQVRRILNSSRT